ncbi:collagen alpha-1(I) chain-like [Prionailurus viverrinus]|uniref:collagen alpha-1(I) chain-like n=1 Tax=Prionailurus viverrinus TaxID=61388 RepID=UPI001FF2D94F|nr:collagen alpha-1(I) chain-like [Prionailurus viverrinus]
MPRRRRRFWVTDVGGPRRPGGERSEAAGRPGLDLVPAPGPGAGGRARGGVPPDPRQPTGARRAPVCSAERDWGVARAPAAPRKGPEVSRAGTGLCAQGLRSLRRRRRRGRGDEGAAGAEARGPRLPRSEGGPGRGFVNQPPSSPQLTDQRAAIAPPTWSNEPLQRALSDKAATLRSRPPLTHPARAFRRSPGASGRAHLNPHPVRSARARARGFPKELCFQTPPPLLLPASNRGLSWPRRCSPLSGWGRRHPGGRARRAPSGGRPVRAPAAGLPFSARSPAEEAKAAASSLCLQTYPVSQCGRINHFWTPTTTVPIAIYASDDSLSLGDQGTPGEPPPPPAAAAGGKMHFLLGCPAGAGPRIPGPDSQTPQAWPRPPRSLPSPGKALLAFPLPQIPEDKSCPPKGDQPLPATRGALTFSGSCGSQEYKENLSPLPTPAGPCSLSKPE